MLVLSKIALSLKALVAIVDSADEGAHMVGRVDSRMMTGQGGGNSECFWTKMTLVGPQLSLERVP